MALYDISVVASNSAGPGQAATITASTTPVSSGRPIAWGYGGGGQYGPGAASIIAAEERWAGCPMDLRNGTLTTSTGLNMNGYGVSSNGKPIGLISSMEMLYNGWDSTGASINNLLTAANGGYNTTWTNMLTGVKNLGYPVVSNRAGWEGNGNWMGWGPGGNLMSGGKPANTNCTPANYVGAFKQIAQLVRKILPGTLVEWNVNWQGSNNEWGCNPTDLWPGKFSATNPGGADVMSMDLYQANFSGTGQTAWNNMLGGQYGLTWLSQFSAQQGVPIVLSEIGIGAGNGETGGGNTNDDAAVAQLLLNWIAAQPNFRFLFLAAWPPCLDLSAPGLAPNTQAVLSNWLKGTSFANPGNWWTGTPLPSQGADPPAVPGPVLNLREVSATPNAMAIAFDPNSAGGAIDKGGYAVSYRVDGTSPWSTINIPVCTPGSGSITFNGHVWSITAAGVIQTELGPDTRTSAVTAMMLVNSLIWQLNKYGNWYSTTAPNSAWSAATTTSPLDGGVTITGLSS